MRNLLFIIVVGLALYGGYAAWNNFRATAPPAQVAGNKTEEPAPVLKKEPVPTPDLAKIELEPPKVEPDPPKEEPAPPVPVPPVKKLAPEGVFFALRAMSVTTDEGVRGIRVGTKVTLVKDAGAVLRVSDGKQEFDARREFLTNDLDIVAQIVEADQAASAQTRQVAATRNLEFQRQQQERAEQQEQSNRERTMATSSAAADRQQRIADIRKQIADITSQKNGISVGTSGRTTIMGEYDARIRELQKELWRLGVAGAALERQ